MFAKGFLVRKNYTQLQKLFKNHVSFCRLQHSNSVHKKARVFVNSVRYYSEVNLANLKEQQLSQKVNEDKNEAENEQLFENTEAKWYHDKILKLPGYEDIIVPSPYNESVSEEVAQKLLDMNWKMLQLDELVDNFKIISSYLYKQSQNCKSLNYDPILQAIGDRLSHFNDEQLETILRYYQLLKFENKKSPNKQFIRTLDVELKKRINEMPLEQKLKICDLLHMALMSKVTYSFWKAMKTLSRKIHQMSPQQMIHFCYLLIPNKTSEVSMYEMEYNLTPLLPKMTLDELGIVALLFFKRRYQARSEEFWNIFLSRTSEFIDEMESYNVTSFMKFFRSFRRKEGVEQFANLLSALEKNLDKYGAPCLSHVAQAASNNMVYNEKLMTKILERYIADPKLYRLKDFERICVAASTFGFEPTHPIFPTIVEQLNNPPNRNREFQRSNFTRSVPISCMFMGQVGYFNLPLLEKVMDPSFYTPIYHQMINYMNLEYLWLDQSIEIEIPNFKGQRLDDKIIKKLSKYYKTNFPVTRCTTLGKYTSTALEISNTYQTMWGQESVMFAHVLPHYVRPDLLIVMDSANKPLPVAQLLSRSETIKYIPEEYKNDYKWFALVIGTEYTFLHNSDQCCAFFMAKLRQLQKLGYIPLLVSFDTWRKVSKNKEKYLESILFDENERVKIKNELLFIE